MKKIKNCTNIAITILLICTILITMLSAFVRFSLTNKNVYLSLLESTDTYNVVTDALYIKMSNILGDDISEDLKKSIITEDDVRKEADVVLDIMMSNLIKGQSIVPQINTDVYKVRIAEAISSLTGYDSYINNRKNITSSRLIGEYTIQPMNLTANIDYEIHSNYLNVKDSRNTNDDLFFENLATRAELEAQARAMLKEKGMTEAQARAKLAEKGISEEQAWQYLKDNGYLDEEASETDKESENLQDAGQNADVNYDNEAAGKLEDNVNSSEYSQGINSQTKEADDGKISKKKIQNAVMSIILDKDMSFEQKMDKIYSELMNEAEIIINKEMENLNFSKLISSNLFNISVKITSLLYRSFYIGLSAIFILFIALGIINNFKLIELVSYLSKSMLIAGIMSTSIFGFVYLSKFYNHFNAILNKAYFEPMLLSVSEYFCRILFISSAGVFIAGLIMNIFMIKKRLTRR